MPVAHLYSVSVQPRSWTHRLLLVAFSVARRFTLVEWCHQRFFQLPIFDYCTIDHCQWLPVALVQKPCPIVFTMYVTAIYNRNNVN